MKVEMDLRTNGDWVGIRLYPENPEEMAQVRMLSTRYRPKGFEEIFGNFNPFNLLITVEPLEKDWEK